MKGFIAVHCGAGEQREKNFPIYNKLSRNACKVGMKVIRNGGSATEAVKEAVIVLENNPTTNAGYGSNLTAKGHVEADAAIMDGKTLLYGGCGAVPKIKNPIALAYDICMKRQEKLPLGLVPPSLLVGKGAFLHAKSNGIKTVANKDLISPRARRQHRKYRQMLDETVVLSENRMDTVGALCIDTHGNIASALSSGGLLLKKPGRVGQAALNASGVWADSFDKNEAIVAVCTTGCGEHLVQTLLAKEIANDLKLSSSPITDLHSSMTDKFLNSRLLHNVQQRMGGALVLHRSKQNEGTVLWSHTTRTMSVGFMGEDDDKPKGLVSQMPFKYESGSIVVVGGSSF